MRRGVVWTGLWGLALLAAAPVPAQDPVKTLQRVDAQVGVSAPAVTPAPAPSGVVGGPEDNMLLEGESLYKHRNERDPFTPLVRGAAGAAGEVKVKFGTTGLARFTVESCALEAILDVGGKTVAWFQGPDGKPYKAVTGEHFADGVVLEVNYATGEVVVQQELNDPTAIKPFRNLVLKIRSQEGEGQ